MSRPCKDFRGTPSVPDLPDLDLSVYETQGLKGFEDKITEAVALLSKSSLARKLAEVAIDADYIIVIEEDPAGETREQYGNRTRGSVDHRQKLIFLRRESDTHLLALTLVHELAHVSQRVKSDIRIDSLEDHPLTLLKKLLAMEADARAHEVGFALDMHDAHPAILDAAVRKRANPLVDSLVKKVSSRLTEIDPGAVMAAAFKAYYNETSLVAERENALLEVLEAQEDAVLQNPLLLTRMMTDDALLEKLDLGGVAYLKARKDYIALDHPLMASVSETTFHRLAALEKRRRQNPATAKDAAWQAPVYKVFSASKPGPRP